MVAKSLRSGIRPTISAVGYSGNSEKRLGHMYYIYDQSQTAALKKPWACESARSSGLGIPQ